MKSKQELIEEWESAIEDAEFYGKGKEERLISYMKDFVSDLKQLDEPEVLSQEFINEKAVEVYADTADAEVHAVFRMRDLQNLLVPEQDEVDQAYKDGYETGKQHPFYKGYLEGLTDKESEPETVADVVTNFWKSLERLKEVMSMEVEELEE